MEVIKRKCTDMPPQRQETTQGKENNTQNMNRHSTNNKQQTHENSIHVRRLTTPQKI